MELRQLRYFLAVADEMNISAAARKLNLTQPALSRHIKALEEILGWTLIERGARSIALTREGRVVESEGRRIVAEVEAGLERMRQEVEGVALRVGFAPSLAKGFLGVALDRFRQMHPGTRVALFDQTSREMEDGIADGSLDVMVAVRNERREGVRWVSLRRDRWRVAVPAGHALADRERLAPADLDGERLLLFARHDYPGYWNAVTGYFQEHGINAKVAAEFDGVTSMAAGLEGGLGVALVAAGSGIERSGMVEVKDIEPGPGMLCVAAGLPDTARECPLAGVFVEELKRAAAESAAG